MKINKILNRFVNISPQSVVFYLQRTIKSYNLREVIAKFEAGLIGKQDIEGSSNLFSDDEHTYLQKLINDGYVEFDEKINSITIDKILEETKNLNLYDPYNLEAGNFPRAKIPTSTHVANFYRSDLVKVPAILQIANDPGILRIVQNFLGAAPLISNINMWWSIAGKNKAQEAQLFHRDVDDIKFCKLFIYLTDVGPKDGPHTYVRGSSSTNSLTKIRRYEDSEIISEFGDENIINFCRPKGSFFIVDTYGFHKGTLPIENDRLLLQIQYSLNPIGIEKYVPQPIKEGSHFNKYINKLILR